jgi:hypothetical protein
MADLRFTQASIEILRKGDPKLRFTQASGEVLRKGNPKLRFTQASVEVLRSSETGTGTHGNFFLVF